MEGVFAIGKQLSLIQFCYDIGVRWMLMVYNRANLAGSGCHDAVDKGLTDFGREVVREMDRVGMIKCCTHTGYRTAMDVLTMTERPCIFSHSNPRALRDHPRNIPDELIDACAATGGVVCITGIGIFLGDNDVSVSTFVNHVDYVTAARRDRTCGYRARLRFRSERDGFPSWTGEHLACGLWLQARSITFVGPEELPRVTEEMLRRGFSDDEVRAVLGGNLLRVAREVWR